MSLKSILKVGNYYSVKYGFNKVAGETYVRDPLAHELEMGVGEDVPYFKSYNEGYPGSELVPILKGIVERLVIIKRESKGTSFEDQYKFIINEIEKIEELLLKIKNDQIDEDSVILETESIYKTLNKEVRDANRLRQEHYKDIGYDKHRSVPEPWWWKLDYTLESLESWLSKFLKEELFNLKISSSRKKKNQRRHERNIFKGRRIDIDPEQIPSREFQTGSADYPDETDF